MAEKLSLIKDFYVEAFQFFDGKQKTPEIDVQFYDYIGINHTIRVRSGEIFVRIAELCRELPLNAQKALAYILVAKLLRKKVPVKAREVYANSIKTEEMRDKALTSKKTRGRKIISASQGANYDLDEMFTQINRDYFQNKLPKPVLSWSARKTFRILGHHDAAHETIIISRSLDEKSVPRYVVEFVLFHEMLHIFHPTEHRDGRRYNHTPQFRRNEKKFRDYEQAEKWIEKNARSLKLKAVK